MSPLSVERMEGAQPASGVNIQFVFPCLTVFYKELFIILLQPRVRVLGFEAHWLLHFWITKVRKQFCSWGRSWEVHLLHLNPRALGLLQSITPDF